MFVLDCLQKVRGLGFTVFVKAEKMVGTNLKTGGNGRLIVRFETRVDIALSL